MSWTIKELYDKAEWEGGICGLIEYGGSEIFSALGPEVLEAARDISRGLNLIEAIFNEYENRDEEEEYGKRN